MHLTTLIYVSKVSVGFNAENIEDILSVARKKNEASDITGILFFNRNYFFQCLEGSRDKVNEIYNEIVKDARHSNILLLNYKEISSRAFGEWSMGYVPEQILTAPTLLKYSGSKEFNPYEMSGESAYLLLLALKEIIGTA